MMNRKKQLLLAFLEYYRGPIDGIWGPESRAAETAFREAYQISGGDVLDQLRKAVCDAVPDNAEDFWQEIRWFRREEFACRCGRCGGFPREPEELLVRVADRIRENLGCPMPVSSGVRCADHNQAVGGVPNSRHLMGKAVDLCASGKTSGQLLAEVLRQPEIRYAYAIDERYVHMDIA